MTKEELNSVRELKKKICELEWHLKTLRMTAKNIVPILDGLPHSTGLKSRVEKIALNIIADEQQLTNYQTRFIEAALNLSDKIGKALLNAQEKAILNLRYVSCLNFQDIWLGLNISDAKVFYVHRIAVKKILKAKVD